MATISENLQILADSTADIKQAIIDKGGTISGDITTWASAINGLSGGGGSSDEEYTFTGTISYNMFEVTITGSLNKIPDNADTYTEVLLAYGFNPGGICYDMDSISNTGPYTLTVDYDEPSRAIPNLCIIPLPTGTVIPVTFIQQPDGAGGSN